MGARAHATHGQDARATEHLAASLRTGLLRQTNPILARAIWRTSAVPTRSCDELHAGRVSVKQSQIWAGWDIWGMVPQGGQSCETKPIWPGLGRARSPRAKDAKRTQSARRGRAGRGLRDEGRGANVQNEANFLFHPISSSPSYADVVNHEGVGRSAIVLRPGLTSRIDRTALSVTAQVAISPLMPPAMREPNGGSPSIWISS